MKKIIFSLLIASLVLGISASSIAPTFAQEDLTGKIVKLESNSTLYYISADGKRYVFPNEKTYKSWFTDFADVQVVTAEDLAPYPLTGNVQYRPGVLLIKIQTDPKVYAISKNGILRWVTSEGIAKKLYGEHWSEFVDDISVAFFTNYTLGNNITNEDDFDPNTEINSSLTIEENRGLILQALIAKAKQAKTKRCHGAQRNICELVYRLTNNNNNDDTNDNDRLLNNISVRICHFPPGNPAASSTITVGFPALKAHIKHGDTIGACEGDDDDDNTIGLTITAVNANPATSTAQISWSTNKSSSSKVTFATKSLSTATTTSMVSTTTATISHSLTLTGLTPSTTYYYRVESTKGTDTATSTEKTFTTDSLPDTAPPIISSTTATPSSAQAVITWTTNEASTSNVRYATDPIITASSIESITNNTLVTNHQLTLTGLTASTTYHFIVKSIDGAGNTATSTDQTFSTL